MDAADTPSSGGWSGSDTGAAVGAGSQMGGDIASGIMALIASMKETQSSKMARGRWEGLMPSVQDLMGKLYNNPLAERTVIPYSWNAGAGVPSYYKFAPDPEMKTMYANFLNRKYGISNSVANSMIAGSMKPLDVSKLGVTPSVAGAAKMYKINADSLSNAAMGAQTPGALRQQDYLNNAATLSQFNLTRAKQLGDLIG
jgi:hypothetical protein